jgi:hypothetical protein
MGYPIPVIGDGASVTRADNHSMKGRYTVKFSSAEEFELHVHKCFGKIFEGLMKVDAVVKEGAEKEESERNHGVMCELRDTVEEVILHCHLAWQYHRLSRMTGGANVSTWDQVENGSKSQGQSEEQ